ncbi:MAG: sigma-70 family RNA polymerase sigma factor [Planctomycetaceae bacterium]
MTRTSETTLHTDRHLFSIIAVRDESPGHWREAEAAYAQLYSDHARMLLAFLSSRVKRSELEDIHQEIWSRVWQHLPEKFDGDNFRAWLFRIARNYVIQESRKRRPDLAEDLRMVTAEDHTPDHQLVERERMEILKNCLSKLEQKLAELVQSRLGGESYEDICERIGLQPARAHKLFHTAKTQLTTCVEHHGLGQAQ